MGPLRTAGRLTCVGRSRGGASPSSGGRKSRGPCSAASTRSACVEDQGPRVIHPSGPRLAVATCYSGPSHARPAAAHAPSVRLHAAQSGEPACTGGGPKHQAAHMQALCRACKQGSARARLAEEGRERGLQRVEHLPLHRTHQRREPRRARGRLQRRLLHARLCQGVCLGFFGAGFLGNFEAHNIEPCCSVVDSHSTPCHACQQQACRPQRTVHKRLQPATGGAQCALPAARAPHL